MQTNRRMLSTPLSLAAMALLAAASVMAGPKSTKQLPDPVAKAVKEKFPDATVVGFEREREGGVKYYEVELRQAGDRIEVEVAPDGKTGEIESVVAFANLPQADQTRVRVKIGQGKIVRIEKHVRIGRGRGGTFEPLKTPVGFYEVKYRDGKGRREIKIAIDPNQEAAMDDEDEDDDHDDDDDDDDDDD